MKKVLIAVAAMLSATGIMSNAAHAGSQVDKLLGKWSAHCPANWIEYKKTSVYDSTVIGGEVVGESPATYSVVGGDVAVMNDGNKFIFGFIDDNTIILREGWVGGALMFGEKKGQKKTMKRCL